MGNEIKFCVCCLQICTPLLNIKKCRFSDCLNSIVFNSQIDLPTRLVCYQCHGVLKKIALFRLQVAESFKVITNHKLLQSDIQLNPPKLEKSKTVTNSYCNYTEELTEEPTNNLTDSKLTFEEILTDIKTEDCDPSDYEIPLSVIKEEQDNTVTNKKERGKRKIKKKTKTNKKESPFNPNITKRGQKRMRQQKILDPDKIKMIIMTKNELLLERNRDLQSDAYLKFPYRCDKCIIGFDYEQTLKDHEQKKHNAKTGRLVCDICESVFKAEPSFNTHCRRHILRFECVACGKRTIDKDAMLKHYGSTHDQDSEAASYNCTQCGLVSTSYRALRYHREKHREKPQCADCGKTFTNKNSLRLHILNIHQCERTFSCTICDKVYKGKSGLSTHMWSHDASRGPLAYCAPCGVQFKTSYNYRHHLRTHSRHVSDHDLRYACEECGARFASARRLADHRGREHEDCAAHACALCHKAFKLRVGLDRHTKFVHEKRRPPRNKMCHHCGRGFTTAAILRTHIRTHTGERPLQCAICTASFAHSAALYTHNKLVHAHRPTAADTMPKCAS